MTEQCGNCKHFEQKQTASGEDVSGECNLHLKSRFYADWCKDYKKAEPKYFQPSTESVIKEMLNDAKRINND